MKRNSIATVLIAAGLAALPMVAVSQAPSQKPAPAAPRMGAGQNMDSAAMAEQMKKMQAQMDRIRQSTDPKEREKVLAEHMNSMQEAMQNMRGMGGGMMMGGGMGGAAGGSMTGSGMMGGTAAKGGARAPGPDQRLQMMENRMDMMQMMMEQMIQREQMMQPGSK